LDVIEKSGQSVLGHRPYNVVVYRVVPMDQDVAERNNTSVLPDPVEKDRIIATNAVQRLADDLELAFDGAAK
jgi:phosphomannomutase